MDRISDSGSDGCGSIPHGGTNYQWIPSSDVPAASLSADLLLKTSKLI